MKKIITVINDVEYDDFDKKVKLCIAQYKKYGLRMMLKLNNNNKKIIMVNLSLLLKYQLKYLSLLLKYLLPKILLILDCGSIINARNRKSFCTVITGSQRKQN